MINLIFNNSIKKTNPHIKLLLTSIGLEGGREIRNELLKLIQKNISTVRVFLVSTATKGSNDWKWVDHTVKQLEKIGINSQNITIFSLDKEVNDNDLKDIDLVYVCGGNTFLYLDGIRKTGLDLIMGNFIKRGGIYFGVSAGSIIVSPTIELANWGPADENIINLQDLKALNIIPFFIYPHFENRYHSIVQHNSKKMKKDVVAINDNQAVLIENGKIKIIGDDY